MQSWANLGHINNSLEEKQVFVPPPETLTNQQPGPSITTIPMRAAEAKGIAKLPEIIKILNISKDTCC